MRNTLQLRLAAATLLALVGALALLPGLPARPAYAAVFTVTKTADTNDGTCDADCSLREAVIAANAAAGHDNIQIPVGTYTLTLGGSGENLSATGDLDVTDSVSFNGAGMTTTIISGGSDNVIQAHDSAATLILTNLTVTNGGGAGIFANNTPIQLSTVTVSNNGNIGVDTLGAVTVQSSIIDSNGIGGIWGSAGDISFRYSTLSRNGGRGVQTDDGNITTENATISGNGDDGIFADTGNVGLEFTTVASNGGTGVVSDEGLIFLEGTIVANNDAADCGATVEDSDHSLDTDGSCGLSGTGDISDGDANLGPLQDNSGTTETRALLTGSDAIDAGGSSCPEDDQRGEDRPGGAACDIGAYEGVSTAPTATPTPPCVENCPTAVPTAVRNRRHTPTSTSTPEPADTPTPQATNTAAPPAPPTRTGGPGGVVIGPDTGSGGDADPPSGDLRWAMLALALGASAMLGMSLSRRRR